VVALAARPRECVLSISRFFRDRGLWEVLGRQILPELIETGKGRVRAWCAGCARGEEVYSLKILWERMRDAFFEAHRRTPHSRFEREDCAHSIRPPQASGDAPAFAARSGPVADRFAVKPALKAGIKWVAHDFFFAPPGGGFHLIFIRNNLLTYYPESRILAAMPAILALQRN
jgi:chemotaxis methyl-accepting protein methylase